MNKPPEIHFVTYVCRGCGWRTQLVTSGRYGEWIELGVVTEWVCARCLDQRLGTRVELRIVTEAAR